MPALRECERRNPLVPVASAETQFRTNRLVVAASLGSRPSVSAETLVETAYMHRFLLRVSAPSLSLGSLSRHLLLLRSTAFLAALGFGWTAMQKLPIGVATGSWTPVLGAAGREGSKQEACMYVCMRTYRHTYMHTYRHPCMRSYIRYSVILTRSVRFARPSWLLAAALLLQ